jgi:hypothetical protein
MRPSTGRARQILRRGPGGICQAARTRLTVAAPAGGGRRGSQGGRAISIFNHADIRRVAASVAAGQTDAVLLPGEADKVLLVTTAYALTTAATALTFNRFTAGAAGTAVSPAQTSANGYPTVNLGYNPDGWFRTYPGQGLSVTTGAGQTHAIYLTAVALPSLDSLYLEGSALSLLLEDSTPLLLESA